MDITIVMLTSVLTAEVNLLDRGLLAVDGRITQKFIPVLCYVTTHGAFESNQKSTYQIFVVDSAAQVNEKLLFKENRSSRCFHQEALNRGTCQQYWIA